ncbi:hypothetical protein C1I98_17030 [Spongiactinospora gelatinilytica]|uniref:DUF6884 domain-containing protein n=1 Tax=Spongiactinospora gelatinilytica TaxID=2666298 RepID=A0A2W2H4T6_9ACTN|nr:DUF6884 domain-containing protein [Spongiactinospora gelatinilytica]PZG44538.1 hypothetical protein C1I98_17030 [Spongiactinospora gelatinilytica]
MKLVIVGCSRRKRDTATPVPALDLYEGGCIPQLRRRIGHLPGLRRQVRILSAEHGLIDADQPLLPYDRVLTPGRACELRRSTGVVLARYGTPTGVLLIAEPPYQDIVREHLRNVRVRLVNDPRDWATASVVLDTWGWP